MFRFRFGSEAGDPDSFSVPFPGAEASLKNPKQLFALSPSHIAVPFYRTTTAAIARTIPFITPTTVSYLVASFTRASVATVVNSEGLIEVVAPDTPRFDHDPGTGAPKGLLLEESRTNTLLQSADLTLTTWGKSRVTITSSTQFPLFTSGNVYLVTANGVAGSKVFFQIVATSTSIRTISCFMRRGTNNFAQIFGSTDTTVHANYNLLNGVVGTRGSGVIESTIQPWREGFYRCTMTTASTTMNGVSICIVNSTSDARVPSNLLATSIYVAAPQLEIGTFATSYIPTGSSAVTRAADDFEEVPKSFPSTSDLLGCGVTTSHIGHQLAGAETAAMSQLQVEASAGGVENWGAELLFTS